MWRRPGQCCEGERQNSTCRVGKSRSTRPGKLIGALPLCLVSIQYGACFQGVWNLRGTRISALLRARLRGVFQALVLASLVTTLIHLAVWPFLAHRVLRRRRSFELVGKGSAQRL